MNLANLLPPEQIVPELSSTDSDQAIHELVGKLCGLGLLPESSKDQTVQALKEREDKITTGIGSGVAIPHIFSEDIKETAMIFGRSTEGIDFEAIDNNPAHFIVLFVIPKKDSQTHLQTLSAIAKLFIRGGIREQLLEATTKEEIFSVFKKEAEQH